jgi:predicted ester cyclase
MSVQEDNKARQRRIFEEIFNERKLELTPEFWATDFVEHRPEGDFTSGAGAKGTAMFFVAFPDLHVSIDDMFAEGDKVVTRITMTGTFTGEFRGLAPTGKRYSGTGIIITQWLNGKEIEAWFVYDQLAFYRQLGINPPDINPI